MARLRVAVVGAGVMGLWSAVLLREMGHDVVLLDAWGAGHPRATSSGESRVIRCSYGGSRLYAGWSARSLRIWDQRQRAWRRTLLKRAGALWLVTGDTGYALRSLDDLKANRQSHERLDRAALKRRYPQIRLTGVRWAIIEQNSGALLARRACLALRDHFLASGGQMRIAQALPPGASGRLRSVRTAKGKPVGADRFLFACGPWLPGLFPDLLGGRIRVRHKEVFFFGTPAGDDSFDIERLPVWNEIGSPFYGIPAMLGRGFKVHPDLPGRPVDPTTLERRTSPRLLRMAREHLGDRFPAMKDAPLVETRVCQYESTRDDHLILDRHPRMPNVWIMGGGSGHGFKHAPVAGEVMASALAANDPDRIPAVMRLSHRPVGHNF